MNMTWLWRFSVNFFSACVWTWVLNHQWCRRANNCDVTICNFHRVRQDVYGYSMCTSHSPTYTLCNFSGKTLVVSRTEEKLFLRRTSFRSALSFLNISFGILFILVDPRSRYWRLSDSELKASAGKSPEKSWKQRLNVSSLGRWLNMSGLIVVILLLIIPKVFNARASANESIGK